jgi:5'-3' exonuclease
VDPTILSYYPTYSILDEVLTNGSYDTLNLYFDIKNNLQTLYMEHAILNLVESTLRSGYTDTSIFESVIQFLSFHKKYALNRNINVNFFIFLESGKSNYHLNISNKYKISRRIDDLYGLDREKRDLFFSIVQKNFQFLEIALNKMPNIKVIRIPNLEADFVPFYLVSRKLVDTSDNVAHVIYSNDHDLLQCLNDHVYVYVKVPKNKKIVKKGNALRSYLKFNKDYPDCYLPLVMSIIGDTGDDVYGIRGIGGKTMEKILDETILLTGDIENLYENVRKGKPIFNTSSDKILNKNIREVVLKEENERLISNNLKLVSFELLSRELDDPTSTEMVEKRKIIKNVMDKNEITEIEVMRRALEKSRITFEEGELDIIYHNNGGLDVKFESSSFVY